MNEDIKQVSSGNTYVLDFNIVNEDNSPRDLSNTQDIRFGIAKWSHTPILELKSLADPEISIVNAANGEVDVTLTPDMLNNLPKGRLYYYELWQINTFNEPLTLAKGYFNLIDRLIEE